MEVSLHSLFRLVILLLFLLRREGVHSSLTVVSQSNLFSPNQFGRQIELTSVLPTNESFVINYEEGYFLCPKKLNEFPKKFRLSRICDGFSDCALGSDELFLELKCAHDCEPACSIHGLCMRASALDPKGHCRCDDGYGGSDCSLPNVNECKYRPCGMMAECIDKIDGYECKCLPGFKGNGFNCASVDDVLNNVKDVLKSDSSQFKDPNIDLTSVYKPIQKEVSQSTTLQTTTTEAPSSPQPLSIILPISPTDVVDRVKEILGNNVRQKSHSTTASPLVTPGISNKNIDDLIQTFDPLESPIVNEIQNQSKVIIKSTTPKPTSSRENDIPSLLSPVFELNKEEEELFLKELNLIEPEISSEDPRLIACRNQFEGCTDARESCMKDLQSCSLSVLDVSDDTRGKLWGECIMDHHMCIMNKEPFCMKGFQKCSMAAIEVLKNQLPRNPFSENIEESKSPRLSYEGVGEGPFTLSFHFRVCVNGYLDCLEGSERSTVDCKNEFDECSLRLLNASRHELTVRTQVTIPGLSECIQSFVECIDAEGFTCYADYNKCTLVALEAYSSNSASTTPMTINTTPAFVTTTLRSTASFSSTSSGVYLSSSLPIISTSKPPEQGTTILEICKAFGATNRFGSFSGRPAISTVDCVWDYFSCTKNYGTYPQNKACCDARFNVCCNHIMNGGHTMSITTEISNSYGPDREEDNCSIKLNECIQRGSKTIRQCKLEFNHCSLSASGIDLSTKRPINDIDLPGQSEFLRPSFTSTIKPIQDINLPQNQEFLLQSGDPDPIPSLVGVGEPQVIHADEEFMACLLRQFDCTHNCPPLKVCSELAGVDSHDNDNVGDGSNTSEEFFLPPVNFSLIGSSLLSSAEDKERMFCVREFFACNEPSEDCKFNFKKCVDMQESFNLDELCGEVKGRPENYLVPHPLDCTKFYSCQSLGSGLGYKPHLMDCPFSTGFDKKLKICNFIQSLPRCRNKSSRTARLLSGKLARSGRSGTHVGEVGFLTSTISASASWIFPPHFLPLVVSVTLMHVLLKLS